MSAPTSLTGFMDDGALYHDGYLAALDYLLEHVPQLLHPQSVYVYAQMRTEAQLGAILRVYRLALERATWTVDGAGCRDEVTARLADDLGLPIKGTEEPAEDDPEAPKPLLLPTGARRRGFTWAEHLRLAGSLSLAFGHAPFAQQWALEDGQMRLKMVQERMPQTITNIRLNPDGTLRSAVQSVVPGRSAPPEITTANHALVWYAREREGSNFFGRSIMREAYSPWLIKTEMMRILPTMHRRNGMGVWQVNAPAGAQPGQIAEAQRIASSTRASENAGIGLPQGFTAELRGMTGTLPDTLGFIQYLDRLQTRNALVSIIDMATAEKGNRSLGETIMQLMVFAQQAEALRIAGDATAQIAIPLVDANWGEDEPAPCIDVADVGADEQLTAQDINWLMEYGGLTPDDSLESSLRHRKGLPPIDPTSRRVAPAPTDPAATATP